MIKEDIWKYLAKLYDQGFMAPTIEMNLIDKIDIKSNKVSVVYNLTALMCPPFFDLTMGRQIQERVLQLDDIDKRG